MTVETMPAVVETVDVSVTATDCALSGRRGPVVAVAAVEIDVSGVVLVVQGIEIPGRAGALLPGCHAGHSALSLVLPLVLEQAVTEAAVIAVRPLLMAEGVTR